MLLTEKEVKDWLNAAAGNDEHIQYIMEELEKCDDMLYSDDLSPEARSYWEVRKQTLLQVRDNYCKFRNK